MKYLTDEEVLDLQFILVSDNEVVWGYTINKLKPQNKPNPSNDFIISLGKLINYKSILMNPVIPEGVIAIGKNVFNAKEITQVTIPNTVLVIEEHAFKWCTFLNEVILMKNSKLNHIAEEAFMLCSSLTEITLPESLLRIGKLAFSLTGLKEIKLPSKLTTICDKAFFGCSQLKTIEIPKSVKSIGLNVFGDCKNLAFIYYKGTKKDWNQISFPDKGLFGSKTKRELEQKLVFVQ